MNFRRDDFIKGQKNTWSEIFPEYIKEINKIINEDIKSKLILEFSTTTIKEKVAFEVSLMDSMSKFVDYEFSSMCGIPEINLKGTIDHYKKILDSINSLSVYDLNWWFKEIIPIIVCVFPLPGGP